MSVEVRSWVTQELDEAKVEEFAGKMVGVLNDAMLALMTSIGHQTGLFDAMAELQPSTSEEVASAADLDERYVREWLGAMTVGGVVDYDPAAATYHLPPESAACLTRAAGPDNIANLAQFTALLGNVEGGIVESFRGGGGVSYSEYPRFQQLMAEDSAQVYGATLIETTLPLVPGLLGRLRGRDRRRRRGMRARGSRSTLWRGSSRRAASPATTFRRKASPSAGPRRKDGLYNARFVVKDIAALDEPRRLRPHHGV